MEFSSLIIHSAWTFLIPDVGNNLMTMPNTKFKYLKLKSVINQVLILRQLRVDAATTAHLNLPILRR